MEGRGGKGMEHVPARTISRGAGLRQAISSGKPEPEAIIRRREGLVLMAEDNDDARESYAMLFEAMGLCAGGYRMARDGFEALGIFMKNPISIVLSDIHMVCDTGDAPGNGIWLAREIRKADAEVPIIIISGGAGNEERAAALSAGACEFLVKPVGMDTLAQIINAYGGLELALRH